MTCVGVRAAAMASCHVDVPPRLIAASWSSAEALAASRAEHAAVSNAELELKEMERLRLEVEFHSSFEPLERR